METVTVRVPQRLNLEQTQKVVANVLGKLGCPGCLSGYDIRFTQAINYAVDPASLAVHETTAG
jgi:hypothetical protein